MVDVNDPKTGEPIRPRTFHETPGLDDWRVVGEGACAYFRTGSFATGAGFVRAISEALGADDAHPDIDLRRHGVTVRLVTISKDYFGLTTRHVALAARISRLARELDLAADPSFLQTVQVTIDALVGPEVVPFWRALLGYAHRAGSPEDLVDPRRRGAPFYFQQMDAPRPQRNRVHVDVWVPYDQAEARIAAALAAGGRLVNDADAPHNWVLADAEGNEACVGVAGPIAEDDQDADQAAGPATEQASGQTVGQTPGQAFADTDDLAQVVTDALAEAFGAEPEPGTASRDESAFHVQFTDGTPIADAVPATAVVVAIREVDLPGPFAGFVPGGVVDLRLEVTPPDGAASYTTHARLYFSTPERRARIANPGTRLPIRFDPEDPLRIEVDKNALGLD